MSACACAEPASRRRPLLLLENTWLAHRVVVTDGRVDAFVAGVRPLATVMTTPIAHGAFGFSAATGGGNPLGVAIDKIVFTIPNPACPDVWP